LELLPAIVREHAIQLPPQLSITRPIDITLLHFSLMMRLSRISCTHCRASTIWLSGECARNDVPVIVTADVNETA